MEAASEIDVVHRAGHTCGDDSELGRTNAQSARARSGRAAANTAPVSRAELLERFDKNVAETRAALIGRTDGEMMAIWSLKHAGQKIFTMPRASVWRGFVMNHHIHHRAQLGVYLRLCDVPVPAMYGPTADEAPNF